MPTLSVRLPATLKSALQSQAAAFGVSQSALAREALRRYLRIAEFRALRTKLVARAQAKGLRTERDILGTLGQA